MGKGQRASGGSCPHCLSAELPGERHEPTAGWQTLQGGNTGTSVITREEQRQRGSRPDPGQPSKLGLSSSHPEPFPVPPVSRAGGCQDTAVLPAAGLQRKWPAPYLHFATCSPSPPQAPTTTWAPGHQGELWALYPTGVFAPDAGAAASTPHLSQGLFCACVMVLSFLRCLRNQQHVSWLIFYICITCC